MTAAERRLWSRLRANQFKTLQFCRQVPIGPYVADFYCSIARVVVEVDGPSHTLRSRSDMLRSDWLSREGILVIRFPNSTVMHDMDIVLNRIAEACCAHVSGDARGELGP